MAGGHQAVPVERTQQRPDRDRADVGALLARLEGGVPDFDEPAQLVFAVGVDVRFGDRDRDAVTFPGFHQQRGDAGRGRGQRARRLDVGVRHAPVHVAVALGIAFGAMVEPALAGDVIVHADHVGRARVVAEPAQLVGRGARVEQVVPQLVAGIDHAAQQVPGEPAALVEVVRDVLHLGRAVGLGQIVGLDQFCMWIDGADRAHRQHRRAALDQQGADERGFVAAMRVPDTGQAREARGGADFVDGRVVLDPRITGGHGAGVFCQLVGEGGIDEARVTGAAAVVDQADDRVDPEIAQRRQPFVGP